MARIAVQIEIDAPPKRVWAAVEDVRSHVDWMADAEAIRITSDDSRGVGTTFDCDTRVGPFRLTDRMEITQWEPGRAMGVRHVGLVTGTGVFTLRRAGRVGAKRNRTVFRWSERLVFPWWMGGPVGGVVGGRILRRIWRGNLRRLQELVEGGRAAG